MSSKGSITTSAVTLAIIGLIIGVVIGIALQPTLFPTGEVVPKSDYDTLLAQKNDLQSDYDDLEDENEDLQQQIDDLTAVQLSGEIKLGFLGSMTGDLASFGENELTAAQFAAQHVNEYLTAAGEDWTITVEVEDTQTDPVVCLEKVESFAARGINLLIGPLSSGEVRAIKGYLDNNKILAVSQSSTALDLAVADDYVFRFCPNDLGQSPAIARIIYDDGKSVVIPVVRNDAWGIGLRDGVRAVYTDLGGLFLDGIAYVPGATEFSAEVADLDTKVQDAITTYGAENVAVLFIAFEEAGPFLTEASAYSTLSTVTWFGSDGTALAGAIIESAAVADFCIATEFPNTIFAPTHSAKWEEVRQNNLALVGREPDSYSYAVYDVVWAYALSLLAVDTYDAEAVKAVLPSVTEAMFGASGWVVLDVTGDRLSSDYDIWQVAETAPGVYGWEHTGVWNFASDTLTWD
jgi:branched-chain amino acid transport system substrate-binding protein